MITTVSNMGEGDREEENGKKKWESREKKRKSRLLLSRYVVAWFHFVKLGRSSGVKNDPEPLNII